MIYVVATITLHPGTRSRFLDVMHKLVPQVLAEQGCLEYSPTIDIASGSGAQIAMREDVVTMVERWDSTTALAAHAIAPHMVTFRQDAKAYMISSSLQVITPTLA